MQQSRVQTGDLLITTSGKCGTTAFVESQPDEQLSCSSNFVRVLRADTALLDPRYLFHYSRMSMFREGLRPYIRGTTLQNLSTRDAFAAVKVPLPSLGEQQRIAAILDQADALRARRRQALDHHEALQQAIFRDMFGDPGTNPRQLPTRSLGGWVEEGAPITYGILKPGEDVPGGVPYVRVVDIRERQVMPEAVRRTSPDIDAAYSRSRLRAGDLVRADSCSTPTPSTRSSRH